MYYEQYNNNQCLSFLKNWYVDHFKSKFVELAKYLGSKERFLNLPNAEK